ncbi:hypothetical protein [Cohnella thermotolerans]|uniref:hypothetical protein n=1 Tax=Cohnella thermotolerans TaxID=329858 RepID=UPI00041909DE|nr:hypothetical protein [Cohnella thermotolerans]
MEMDRDLRTKRTVDPQRLEIDISKILAQLGIGQEKWQLALKEPSEQQLRKQ